MSEIPEGATHWGQGANCKFWIKDLRPGISYQFANARNGGGYTSWMIRTGDPLYPITPIASSYTGEGLPPVGTMCEFRNKVGHCGDQWHAAEVMYLTSDTIVLRFGEREHLRECAGYPDLYMFRPARTPEQIAKAERNKACDEMFGIMSSPPVREGNRSDMAEALYDAGYRKTDVQ